VLSLISRGQIYLLLALVGVMILLVMTRPDKDPRLEEAVAPRVLVATVGRHDLAPVERVSGRLEPARRAGLHFELSGQLDERPVEPGQTVREGDLLLSLAAGDFRDTLAEAEAQLEQERRNIQRDRELLQLARRNYALQGNDLDRLEKLGADSLVSRSHLDESRIKLIQLESEVAHLKASVGMAESRLALKQAARNRAARNLDRTRLQAAFSGTVNAVHVQVGDYVTPSQTVVELIETATLDLYVEVRGEVARALAPGQAVDVTVSGERLAGEIVALQIDPDPVTFTHALRVRLSGDRARPGQVAQAHLPLRPLQQVTAVPTTAVSYDEGRTFVFRVNSDTLNKTEVLLGMRVGELQVIEEGITMSDRIVIRDVAALSHGQKVRAVAGDGRAASLADH
jgi:RND family efflux transporter MFP subunit